MPRFRGGRLKHKNHAALHLGTRGEKLVCAFPTDFLLCMLCLIWEHWFGRCQDLVLRLRAPSYCQARAGIPYPPCPTETGASVLCREIRAVNKKHSTRPKLYVHSMAPVFFNIAGSSQKSFTRVTSVQATTSEFADSRLNQHHFACKLQSIL